jgi:hypothetical protein
MCPSMEAPLLQISVHRFLLLGLWTYGGFKLSVAIKDLEERECNSNIGCDRTLRKHRPCPVYQ